MQDDFQLIPKRSRIAELLNLPIAVLRRDGETQCRISLNRAVVDEYAALMRDGTEFPPLQARFDGTSYWLTDGFHRLAAAETLRRTTVHVEVSQGTLAEAQWESYRANGEHGLRRSNEDKRFVVMRALTHRNAAEMSNCEIARHLRVSEKTVRRIRSGRSSAKAEDRRLAIRNGHVYEMDVSNIGKSRNRTSGVELEDQTALDRRLTGDLLSIESKATPEVRCILNVFRRWIQNRYHPLRILSALEELVAELRASTELEQSRNDHLKVSR